jgi:hypothetical protein
MTCSCFMRPLVHSVLLIILLSWSVQGRCQDSLGFAPNGKVKINFQANELTPSYLPFDVPFRLYAVIPDSVGVDSIQITCTQASGTNKCHQPKMVPVQLLKDEGIKGQDLYTLTLQRNMVGLPNDTLIGLISVPFRPTLTYHFSFKLFRRVLPSEALAFVKMIDPMVLDSLLYIYRDGNTDAGNIDLKMNIDSSAKLISS